MDRVRVRLALPEVLSLGFAALCFSDGARVRCESLETDRRAWPLVDGGEPFSEKLNPSASSIGVVLFLPCALPAGTEKALNSWSTTNPEKALKESSTGDLSPVIPAEQTPPMAGNAGGATARPRARC
jgi:hypothetical protein